MANKLKHNRRVIFFAVIIWQSKECSDSHKT